MLAQWRQSIIALFLCGQAGNIRGTIWGTFMVRWLSATAGLLECSVLIPTQTGPGKENQWSRIQEAQWCTCKTKSAQCGVSPQKSYCSTMLDIGKVSGYISLWLGVHRAVLTCVHNTTIKKGPLPRLVMIFFKFTCTLELLMMSRFAVLFLYCNSFFIVFY